MMRRRPEHGPAALLVYLASAIAMLGTAAMSPVLPVMMTGLGLTAARVSLMMTVFTLPVIFSVPVVGWLADRHGRRPVLGVSLLLFGTAGTAIYFVDSFDLVLGLRALQGVGFSGIIPLVVVIIGDLFSEADEVGGQGLRVTFVNLGASLFPVATGYLAEISWQTPFLLFAIAVPAGFVVIGRLPETASGAAQPPRYSWAILRKARDRLVAASLVVGPLRFFLLYGIYTFLPVLVVRHGLTVPQAGVIIGAINVAKLVVASQSRRSLQLGPAERTMLLGMIASTGLLVLFVLADSFVAFVAIAAAFGATDGVTAPLQKSVLTQRTPASIRAGMISFNAVLQNIAKTAAPILLGLLIGVIGIQSVFAVVGFGGGLVALGALALVVRRRRAPSPAE